jgi:hypothetical protein
LGGWAARIFARIAFGLVLSRQLPLKTIASLNFATDKANRVPIPVRFAIFTRSVHWPAKPPLHFGISQGNGFTARIAEPHLFRMNVVAGKGISGLVLDGGSALLAGASTKMAGPKNARGTWYSTRRFCHWPAFVAFRARGRQKAIVHATRRFREIALLNVASRYWVDANGPQVGARYDSTAGCCLWKLVRR